MTLRTVVMITLSLTASSVLWGRGLGGFGRSTGHVRISHVAVKFPKAAKVKAAKVKIVKSKAVKSRAPKIRLK